jgi:hypothetical protein
MKRTLIALAALVMSLTPSLAIAPPAPPAVDSRELTRGFFLAVFGLEYGHHVDAQRVKRYTGQVRFHVTDLSGAGREGAARGFLQSLPGRIGHFRAAVVDDINAANFEVYLVRSVDFGAVVQKELRADAIAMGARCLVGVTTVNGRIERSTAIVVADDDYLFARCLVEEVLQGLGPMNDDNRLVHSVFNDSSHHTTFTDFDRALMNVLYHPLIRPGMTGSEVQETRPAVLRDLGYDR